MKDDKKNKVYFDQNVLGWMAAGHPKTAEYFKDSNLTPVFSQTNNVDDYLKFFRDTDAEYIEMIFEDGRFTDNAHIRRVDPYQTYEHYLKTRSPNQGLPYVLGQFAYKMYGGKTDITFGKLTAMLMKEVDVLGDEILKEALEEIEGNQHNVTMDDVKEFVGHFKEYMKHVSDETKHSLARAITNESEYGGLTDIRKFYKSHQSGYSDIEPPGVFEKIWDRIQEQGVLEGYNITREQFFGLTLYGDNTDSKHNVPEIIMAGYGMLNSVGYWPDKKLKKEKTFFSSHRDMGHAVSAVYSNLFLTADERLYKKAAAIYENLKLGPRIVFFKVNITAGSDSSD